MNHRQFVDSLPAATRRALTKKSDRPGLTALAIHWGLIVCIGWLIIERVVMWQVLIVLQGILLVFLFTTLHETVHRTAFKTPWINEWVARINGFLLLLPAQWFRYFHFAHHRHTQDPQNDPELAVPKPENWQQYAWHISGVPLWRAQIQTLLRNAMGNCRDDFVPASARSAITREARIMLSGYVLFGLLSFAVASDWLLFVWLLPLVFGQPFLRLYLLAEHGRCALVSNMLENSRTTYTNAIVRRLAWNMPYHAEHHTFPAVPFHRLPEFHELAQSALMETEEGYIPFHRAYISSFAAKPRRP